MKSFRNTVEIQTRPSSVLLAGDLLGQWVAETKKAKQVDFNDDKTGQMGSGKYKEEKDQNELALSTG